MHAIEWESVFGRAAPKIPTRRTPPVRRDPESVADRVLASTETGDIKSLEQGLADIRGGIDKLDPLLARTLIRSVVGCYAREGAIDAMAVLVESEDFLHGKLRDQNIGSALEALASYGAGFNSQMRSIGGQLDAAERARHAGAWEAAINAAVTTEDLAGAARLLSDMADMCMPAPPVARISEWISQAPPTNEHREAMVRASLALFGALDDHAGVGAVATEVTNMIYENGIGDKDALALEAFDAAQTGALGAEAMRGFDALLTRRVERTTPHLGGHRAARLVAELQQYPGDVDPSKHLIEIAMEYYASEGDLTKMLDAFAGLERAGGVGPRGICARSCNTLVKGVASAGSMGDIRAIMDYMQENNVTPTTETYNLLLSAVAAQRGDELSSISLVTHMKKLGIEADGGTVAARIDVMVSRSDFEEATRLFQSTMDAGTLDTAVCNAHLSTIAAERGAGNPEVMKFLRKMEESEATQPDHNTWYRLVSASSKSLTALEDTYNEALQSPQAHILEPRFFNTTVAEYLKKSQFEAAAEVVWLDMKRLGVFRGASTYAMLLPHLASLAETDLVAEIFQDIEAQGLLKARGAALHGSFSPVLLEALAKCGLEEQAHRAAVALCDSPDVQNNIYSFALVSAYL